MRRHPLIGNRARWDQVWPNFEQATEQHHREESHEN